VAPASATAVSWYGCAISAIRNPLPYGCDTAVVRLILLVILAGVLPAAALASTAGQHGTATITPAGGGAARVAVKVELARTQAERQRGLMNRRSLAARSGMVFVYPQAHRGGYWMKDTLIPLDIAFADARGRILRIFTMRPCRRDPCRIYDPGVAYRSALEVNAGSFRRWRVRTGDRIIVRAAPEG
jgi:uncharacterized membrane protein (UPF0127 family)